MGKDQSRTIDSGNHICHREGLAGSGSTFQHLFFLSFFQPLDQPINCLRLISSRLERRYEFKLISH